ncbi:hypothetical protein DYY88_12515 [Leptolyngbya iicbica LK]|uniref:Uncharacterized protein n=1 Tax=Leptolyngbya iicbica LK TaxID=2294035 RepID=A0A4V2E2S1_9CYAN|nr:hypothetical protein DYY88_12515 [Leptolyngbya sp. LK]
MVACLVEAGDVGLLGGGTWGGLGFGFAASLFAAGGFGFGFFGFFGGGFALGAKCPQLRHPNDINFGT